MGYSQVPTKSRKPCSKGTAAAHSLADLREAGRYILKSS